MKRISLLLPLLLFSIISFSQNYRINHYSINQGLSQSVIYSLLQDSRGFIWVGTQDGLNRFDGYSFAKYLHTPADTTSLPDNWVYTIKEDNNGDLWIGTRGGLCKFNYLTNSFTRFPHKTEYDSDPYKDNVYGCVINADGKIYTNTPPLINLFDPQTKRYTHYMNTIGMNPNVEEQSLPIIVDIDGLVWAGTTQGLACFDPKTEKFTNYKNNPNINNTLSNNSIQSLFEDNKGRIWVGTPSGIDIFDKSKKTFSRYPIQINGNRAWIRSVIQDSKGYFWIGTQGNGLLKATCENNSISIQATITSNDIQNSSYLNNSFVNALIIDRSENLWIGTLNGLDKTDLKDPKFKLYRKSAESNSVDLLDNVIASIYKDHDGKIWVGNWGKGLNIIDRKTNKVQHFSTSLPGKNHIVNDFVHVIFEYSENEIWIGTRDGIYVYDKDHFVGLNEFYKTNSLPSFLGNRVFSILKDKNNNVWVGTQGGLYYLDIPNKKYQCYTSSGSKGKRISDNLIYSLVFDYEDNLWIATKNGLDKFNTTDGQITNFVRNEKSSNTLSDNYIVSLCHTPDSTLWIGTKTGVNRLKIKSNTFKYYSEADGLPSNIVYEIVADDFGNLWFATGKGLSQFRKGDSKIRTYSEEDGLQGAEFNHRASHKSKDGEIFFGGMNGFNSFYPQELSNNKYIPSLVFTSFQKQNKKGTEQIRIANEGQAIIEYGDYAFNVEFSALEFTCPSKNKYAYKFDGKNSSWIDIENRRFLPFSNLSAGLYKLWVKGSNNDGVWNEEGTFIMLKVMPPWWQSNAAYIIYFFIVVSSIIFFIKYRERKLKEQKRILEQKVKERTEEVEKQKNEIVEKNNELEQQNIEILAQKDTLTIQNEKISKQNKQIKDSINYASRIQSAILPSTSVFGQKGMDHFLIFKPKDIVSGDFYWIKEQNSHLLFSLADCTGHGVPGAFMSILGNSFLNEIVNHSDITKANQVLERLRDLILTSLRQSGDESVTRDGMDISFCEINTSTYELQFAAAYNPLLIIRDGELIELKGDRFPVGHYFKKAQSFTNSTFQLKKGDSLYLLTDGITDQFGGEFGAKLTMKKLKSYILSIQDLSMASQKDSIEKMLANWMGTRYDQIDDITMLGLKIL